jgi:hypothetical protein
MTSRTPAPTHEPCGCDDESEAVTRSQPLACNDITRGKSTERMRELRKRRRRGMIVLRSVRLEPREVEHLLAKGYIDATQRADRKALADAVEAFISDSAL